MSSEVRSSIPYPNATLFTIDYVEVGRVITVGSRSFHALLAGGPQWLMNECIYTVDQHQVTLICTEDGLEKYFVRPAGKGAPPTLV